MKQQKNILSKIRLPKYKPRKTNRPTKKVNNTPPLSTVKKIKQKKNLPCVEIQPITIEPEKKVRKSRRSKSPSMSKMYFTDDTELAIMEYNRETNIENREVIFNTRIQHPFEKLVENIFNTFKFSYFETGPLDVQKETVSHLVANIHKFDSQKGKAFSYFSIVAKNYLIFLNNSTYKRFNQHVDITEEREDNKIQLQCEDGHFKQVELKEFMLLMVRFWDNNINKIFIKQRDLGIANAIIELLRHSDRVDAFNKKALYLYIREISNCKTQQITKVINKMKQYHLNIAKTYLNVGFINTNTYINS